MPGGRNQGIGPGLGELLDPERIAKQQSRVVVWNWPAVGVDGQRAGDTEIVVELHHGRGEPEWVEGCDNVAPAGAGLSSVEAGGAVRNTERRFEGESGGREVRGHGRCKNGTAC